eukprot:3579971-Prymnesium_polylepis.1
MRPLACAYSVLPFELVPPPCCFAALWGQPLCVCCESGWTGVGDGRGPRMHPLLVLCPVLSCRTRDYGA